MDPSPSCPVILAISRTHEIDLLVGGESKMCLLLLFPIQKSRFFRTHILCYFWPCNALLYLIHLIFMGGIFSQRKIRKNPHALVLAKARLSLLLGLLLFYLTVCSGFSCKQLCSIVQVVEVYQLCSVIFIVLFVLQIEGF